MAICIQIFGLSDYAAVHQLQKDLVGARADGRIGDVILLLEHAPVITVGRKRHALSNVLSTPDTPVVTVERGGDVTWHGPGQLVAYPILQLEGARADLHLHLKSLEDAVITLLAGHRLKPVRDARNTGVWLPVDGEALPRKVCSVGIACRRWVSWHGLALNVSNDANAYRAINPCGFDATVMTRLADHLNPSPQVQALAAPLAQSLCKSLDVPREGALKYADSPDEVYGLLNLEKPL